jgi:hypothetical protein
MTKTIGDKVLGWFIVRDEAEVGAAGPPSEVPAAAVPARARAAAVAVGPVVTPAVTPGQPHDARAFAAVYRSAGVAEDGRERLGKVLALLESLPHEASTDVKRAIVGASLEAFGVSVDGILSTGAVALGALDAYVASGQIRTKEVLADAEARISKLTSEIGEVRRLMDVQLAAQQELARSVSTEKARVGAVLDFFGASAAGAGAAATPRLVRLK